MGFQQEHPAGVFKTITRDAPFIEDYRLAQIVRWPVQILDMWNDAQLAAIGITRRADPVDATSLITQSYRASVARRADEMAARGKVYEATKLLLKSERG